MLLSIITVNLNNLQGLKKTFDSVFSQSCKSFEYIVIDGGSTDGSLELIKKEQDQINYWISEPDRGIYPAMNKGIAAAKGKYLLFLNSGDWLCNKGVLLKAEQELKSNETDILYCDVNLIDINKKLAWQKTYPNQIDTDFLLKSALCHQAMFIKARIFAEIGNYREDYRLSSDWIFYFTAFNKGFRFKKIDHLVFCNFVLNGFSSDYSLSKNERSQYLANYYPEFHAAYLALIKPKSLLHRFLNKLRTLFQNKTFIKNQHYFQTIYN